MQEIASPAWHPSFPLQFSPLLCVTFASSAFSPPFKPFAIFAFKNLPHSDTVCAQIPVHAPFSHCHPLVVCEHARMNAHQPTIDPDAQLEDLLEDLLDPSITAIDLCRRHALTLAQLTEFLQGPLFAHLTAAASTLSSARTKLLALDIAPKALAALLATTQADQESRQLNETIRKAATKLLTITAKTLQPTPESPQPATPEPDHPTQPSEIAHTEHPTPVTPPPARSPVQSRPPKDTEIAFSPGHPSPNAHLPAAALRAACGAPRPYASTPSNHPPGLDMRKPAA